MTDKIRQPIRILRRELLVVVGAALLVMGILNTFGVTDIPGDIFWALAGLGLILEGVIESIES